MTYAVLPDTLGATCASTFSCCDCSQDEDHPGCVCFDDASELSRGLVALTGRTHLVVRRSVVLLVREPRVAMGISSVRLAS
jgi:hypothetical protein